MKVIFLKLIRDFRLTPVKLILLLLAASLSGWGISSVVYSYFMTERDFEVNFKQTFPADLTVIIGNYTEEIGEQFLADRNVIDMERREAITARIKNNQDSWMPIIIYGVEDIDNMRYDRFRILEEKNLQPGKILIEQNAMNYLPEEKSEIELMFQGKEKTTSWNVTGEVHDPRQAPATMEGLVYAYSTSLDQIELYLEENTRRLLIETDVSDDKGQLEAVCERLQKIAEESGAVIVSYNIPEPGKHIHQGIVDGIAFLQESGGAILSVMGIILLSLILLTWIYPQVVDIGIMKSLGASTRHIFLSYAAVLTCIITVGLMIGLPLGYQTASYYNRGVAFFQNFTVVRELLPLNIHVCVVLICAIVPLLFGIIPLLKGANTTVNKAINKTFHIGNHGLFRISQRLISGSKFQYVINNLFRHSQRTILIILLLAIGIGLYFTASNVDFSIREDLKEYAQTSRYDVVVGLPEEMDKAEISFLEELPFISSYSPINSNRISFIPPGSGNPEMSVIRVLPADFDIDTSYVQRGKIDRNCSNCIYLCGERMRGDYEKINLGEPIELTYTSGEKRTFNFSGVIRDLVVIGSPFLVFDEDNTWEFNALAIALDRGLSEREKLLASNSIDDAFIEHDINLLARRSISRRLAGIIGHLNPTFLIIRIMGIFTIVLGLLGLIILLNLSIQERTREIGIMKAIGSPLTKISGLFLQEFLWISIFALFAGALIAIPVGTALIGIIAELIVRHPVAYKHDFIIMSVTATIVLLCQTILVLVYNRFKINRNARELLDYKF